MSYYAYQQNDGIDWPRFFIIWFVLPGIGLLIAAVLNLAFAAIAQWLWSIFCSYLHLPEMGFWQMWAILMFLSIIASVFKGKTEVKND